MDFAQIILSPFVWLLTFFYDFFRQLRHRIDLIRGRCQAYPVPVCAEG